jgi:hypothetical protein
MASCHDNFKICGPRNIYNKPLSNSLNFLRSILNSTETGQAHTKEG